jgi:hypothetical protein
MPGLQLLRQSGDHSVWSFGRRRSEGSGGFEVRASPSRPATRPQTTLSRGDRRPVQPRPSRCQRQKASHWRAMEDLVQATGEVERARSVDRLADGSTSDPARAAREAPCTRHTATAASALTFSRAATTPTAPGGSSTGQPTTHAATVSNRTNPRTAPRLSAAPRRSIVAPASQSELGVDVEAGPLPGRCSPVMYSPTSGSPARSGAWW